MAKFNITTPAAGHTGAVGNVHFVDGRAVVDEDANPAELAYFRAQGYIVEEIGEPEAEQADEAPARARATTTKGAGK